MRIFAAEYKSFYYKLIRSELFKGLSIISPCWFSNNSFILEKHTFTLGLSCTKETKSDKKSSGNTTEPNFNNSKKDNDGNKSSYFNFNWEEFVSKYKEYANKFEQAKTKFEHQQQEDDALREEVLYSMGYHVIRFTNDEVLYDLESVIEQIENYFNGTEDDK